MPRPRTNDPSNLPTVPNPTKDPRRKEELVAEFRHRLAYVMHGYEFAKQAIASDMFYNKDLARLKRSLARKHKRRGKGSRLHPEIEMVISNLARQLAKDEGVKVNGDHVAEAATIASRLLKPRRGRPDDAVLEHHVTGLVALIQQYSGMPVLARRYRNSVYDPHFAAGVSRIVPMQFENRAAGVTQRRLVRIVEQIRSEYAGKPLRFLDLFPGYGVKPDADGMQPMPGQRVVHFEPNIPIYCH